MTSVVAIINWNSGQWLRPCIESLLAVATGTEILVIDNASDDDSIESVQGFRNRVTFIRNSVNRGFAAAVNQAFHESSSPYVLILNPDIRVLPGAIDLLEDFMNAHPRAGATGGHVNEKYLPRTFPTVTSLVRDNLGFPRKLPPPSTREGSLTVEQPAAAALMIRREAYESIGGFDEQFHPAWYEDVDFCRRLKSDGWEIYFMPRAEFIHAGGYSAGAMGNENFLRAYYTNQVRYARKYFGLIGAAIVRVSIAAGMLGRMIGKPKQAAAYGKAFIGALGRW